MNVELLKKLGNIEQIAGVRPLTYQNGVKAFEVYNASGLRFTLTPDMGLDLADFSYKGTNVAYYTKNGVQSANSYHKMFGDFQQFFHAGLLKTCGLLNIGPESVDEGVRHALHGNIGHAPAANLSAKAKWVGDDYHLSVSGTMQDTRMFSYNLTLEREISTTLCAKEVVLKDAITNMTSTAEDFMILYHFNFGYPLLADGVRIVKGGGGVKPRNDRAAAGLNNWDKFTAPEVGFIEQVYYHENTVCKDGYSTVGVINDELKLGVYLKYSAKNLPMFVQWKNPLAHEYALGIEPSNCYLDGRALEKQKGTIQTIQPFETLDYELILGILDGADEIAAFEKNLQK